MVVYGVSGFQNDVDSLIWDRFYYIENQRVHFETPIDMNKNDITSANKLQLTNTLNMNNRQIKYLQDGNENNDAVNIKQLIEVGSNLQNFYSSEIAKVNINFFLQINQFIIIIQQTLLLKHLFLIFKLIINGQVQVILLQIVIQSQF